MKSRALFAAALILLAPLAVLAFQDQAVPLRELSTKQFTAGSLKISITNFPRGIEYHADEVGIMVMNTSDDFATFDPRRLSFVDRNDRQVDILGMIVSETWKVAAEGRRIRPKTWIRNSYMTTDMISLPVRLYYEDKLLGTITY